MAQGNEGSYLVTKYQLLQAHLVDAQRPDSDLYLLVTLTCSSGTSAGYTPIFEHILDTVQLYEYN